MNRKGVSLFVCAFDAFSLDYPIVINVTNVFAVVLVVDVVGIIFFAIYYSLSAILKTYPARCIT